MEEDAVKEPVSSSEVGSSEGLGSRGESPSEKASLGAPGPKRDPLLGVAIIKMSMLTNRNGQGGLFRSVYEGLLQDLSLTDAEVDAYLQANWMAVRDHLK